MSGFEECSIIQKLERFSQAGVKPFKNNEDILQKALWIFKLRVANNPDKQSKSSNAKHSLSKHSIDSKAIHTFHRCLNVSDKEIPLLTLFRTFALNQIEKEITILMMLSHFGKIGELRSMEDIQRYLDNGNIARAIAVGRAFFPGSRLLKSRIIIWDYSGEYYRFSKKFIAALTRRKKGLHLGWPVKSYEELLDNLYPLVKGLKLRSEAISDFHEDRKDKEVDEHTEMIDNLMWELNYTLRLHPTWKLNEINKYKLLPSQQSILLALVGKEMNFFPPHDPLFTGNGLARAACLCPSSYRQRLNHLRVDRRLYRDGFIQVCGGMSDSRAMEDPETLQSCEFELTPEFMKKLNIKRIRKLGDTVRKPSVTFEQLVFSEKIKASIELCLTQVHNHETLFDTWQLGKTIGYGTAITILFSGPPGTGKTACAEAIAHQLNKTIMTVNYSQVQNCWVGQTEKNIVKTFREANEAGAVLFWDEADAMFYDRDSASKNWEVRDVNVLLQELERFRGVCILSTNRKGYLDKALERRISMKIEFERPSQEMRKAIWQRLIPAEMPLSKDVSFDEFSKIDLSGGEIKNVILNAARIALRNKNTQSGICRGDFIEAIKLEQAGSWSGCHQTFGFHGSTIGA